MCEDLCKKRLAKDVLERIGPGALAICCSFLFRDRNGFDVTGSMLFWGGVSWTFLWSFLILGAYTRFLSKEKKVNGVNPFQTVG